MRWRLRSRTWAALGMSSEPFDFIGSSLRGKPGLPIMLVGLQPVEWRGKHLLLDSRPACWCGRWMTLSIGPFLYDGSTDMRWSCPEDGNADLIVYYFERDQRLSVASNWQITGISHEKQGDTLTDWGRHRQEVRVWRGDAGREGEA